MADQFTTGGRKLVADPNQPGVMKADPNQNFSPAPEPTSTSTQKFGGLAGSWRPGNTGGGSYLDYVQGSDGRAFNHTSEGYWQQDQSNGNWNLYDNPGGNILNSTNQWGGAINNVNTAQPNPATVNAIPFTQGNLTAGLSAAQASGPAPQDSGQARIGVQAALNAPTFYKPDPASEQIINAKGEKLSYEQYKAQGGKGEMGKPNWTDVQAGNPPPPPNAPVIQQALDEDPGLQQLLANQKAFNDVINQRKSLADEYKAMVKEAGIDKLNTELLNAKNIIEGTEDDLRNEITKAGGFGTESQIQALTLARNKSLIKNYNNLLATKQMAMENINTMIGLAGKDRDFALQAMTQKLNLDNEIIKYRDNMKTKATEQYKYLADKMGFDGLLAQTNNDPYYIKLIEKTLGLTAGGLQQLATRASEEKAIKQRKETLENKKLEAEVAEVPLNRQLKQAQIQSALASAASSSASAAKTRAEIEQMGQTKTINGKPQDNAQLSANGYADRINEANIIISKLGNQFTGKASMMPVFNFMKSSDRQSYEQAQRNFVNAVLRRESGAAISESEFDSAKQQYFPQPGDKPQVVAQKEVSRNTAINNLYREANINRPVLPGQIIESDGKKYKVGADGITLTPL